MSKQYKNLADFEVNQNFYSRISLMVTIKSFDLQSIRNRYLKTKDKKSKRIGSTERRGIDVGGVAKITIEKGEIVNCEIVAKLKEPRGIDYKGGVLSISSENQVFIINEDIKVLHDPWFSYIHTVDINPYDFSSILVSSSGFDAFFEYDIKSFHKTFEWFAWENGFDKGVDPETGEEIYLTRKPEIAASFKNKNVPYILINDPQKQVLPTAKRAAFINSVVYDTKNTENIIATFFHEGAVYAIHKTKGTIELCLDEMQSPHGGSRYYNKFMATNTKGGEVVIGNSKDQDRYTFSSLAGKPDMLSDFEWIQNAIQLDGNIIAIDSNRNSFVIIQPENKQVDFVSFDSNWAVQDLIQAKPSTEQIELLRKIGAEYR
ncbi:MAG: hypothetical protein K9I29_03120 [Bacteroidales bacterium]|nr:hypothetical protein [Bacteroidales bacterium]